MLKFLIFILIFNVLCSAHNFDIYEIRDRIPVTKIVVKRQLGPGPETHPILKDTEDLPQNVAENKQKNSDSVKKNLPVLPQTESVSVNVSSQNAQIVSKNDNQNINKTVTKINEGSKETTKSKDLKISTSPNETKVETVTVSAIEQPKHNSTIKIPKYAATEHPGAALRGFYVFLGLSVLIIIYFIFKAFRLRPGAAPPSTVRKYGIVGRRSDMEMLPLPLAEEDDDDTLFDMGTQMNR